MSPALQEAQETVTLRESVVVRLLRWAECLPADEDLPISKLERYELALFAAELPTLAVKRPVEWWLDQIEREAFRFLGHRVRILREGRS